MEAQKPTVDQVLQMMTQSMDGKLPKSIELAKEVFPEIIVEQALNSAYAMPQENGALDAETRILIYLGIALATGSKTCIEAMMNKSKTLRINKDKILETFKIARYAESSRVLGNADLVFEQLIDEK